MVGKDRHYFYFLLVVREGGEEMCVCVCMCGVGDVGIVWRKRRWSAGLLVCGWILGPLGAFNVAFWPSSLFSFLLALLFF